LWVPGWKDIGLAVFVKLLHIFMVRVRVG
jgi:hypothetical protein